ncbi:hypothetical protein [Tolypothrix sp. VBCCA 56010]|uniref:hypothetical protein n=1 Tax=Tolypothrix sp. VBCCA 56010 TaxID=3137731 RepID=UPI003D7EFD2C
MGNGQWAVGIKNWALRIGFGRDSFHAPCPMPHAHYPPTTIHHPLSTIHYPPTTIHYA